MEKIQPIIVPTDKECLLEGKIVLITGGSSGIGLAIANAFLKSGAKVIIAGTNTERLQEACEKLQENKEFSTRLKSIAIDVRKVENLFKKVEEAAGLYEEDRIDILVNSAGVTVAHDFFEIEEDEYDTVMDINAKGTFFMSQAVSNLMIKRKVRGHILNISSAAALRPAQTPYQMSKWAVRGLTLGLAEQLIPYGIVVNAIAPGPTATPMLGKNAGDYIDHPCTPSGRFAMPEEIASLAVYMASGVGDLIVGDTFYMTGGSGTITLQD